MKRAFSLIEVLVVVAIMAILGGLLLPVMAQARISAKAASCAANLRQQGQAIALYQADSDDVFPPAIDGFIREICAQTYSTRADICAEAQDLYGFIRVYAASRSIMQCPLDHGLEAIDFLALPSPQSPTSYTATGSSYWYNEGLTFRRLTSTSVPWPSRAAILHDRTGAWHGVHRRMVAWQVDARPDTHKGYLYTTVFADGHAKILTPGRLNEARGLAFSNEPWIVTTTFP